MANTKFNANHQCVQLKMTNKNEEEEEKGNKDNNKWQRHHISPTLPKRSTGIVRSTR